jgi:predicted nucleotidyltransferase
MVQEPIFILRGVAGSHAHRLSTPQSDIDLHGTYSYPTDAFWSLSRPQESLVGHDPQDYSYHELEKFLRLASKSNPTVLEILGLEEYHDREPTWGNYLIEIQSAFFSERHVHNAFLGYAESQFRKLAQRGDNFSSDVKNRTNKHARHLFRLIETGHRLYTTGVLQVRVDDPDSYQRYNVMTVDEISDEFTKQWGQFLDAKTVLPDEPDLATINGYLYDYRKAH